MHRLSDWPVLTRIAARSTTATRLDSRAVATLYARALDEDRRDMGTAEREFSDAAMQAFPTPKTEASAEQRAEAYRIALELGINAPWQPATAEDVGAWISWWEPSARLAEAMPEAERKRLCESGWWPPVAPEHSGRVPPVSVRMALRFDDRHCHNTIAAYEWAKREEQPR
ncbi:hypothetical protein XpopCFBP1817_11360 [Xanthomonas populi]|uniref:Uncharacterized protein n=1 Tax=Xanthomonas populi TaxID=53414 RepID=A0A2S7ENJ2_9XANT|nr:hypothetical protein XpopCFBP1817_11360 [Xanthomonas populi]